MAETFWGQKSFVIITGASGGIGRGIATEFAKKVGPGSVFLLTARNEANLNETKSLIVNINANVHVNTAILDLEQPNKDNYLKALETAVKVRGNSAASFEQAIIVHNAASIGNTKLKLSQYTDVDYLQTYFNLNLASPILLNSLFLEMFNDPTKQRVVIQISTVASKMPVKTLGLYGTGKAGRNHMMKCLLAEEQNLITLSYAPAIVATNMYGEAERSGDEDIKGLFLHMKALGNCITAEDAGRKLAEILEEKTYVNGDFIDYYESPEQYHPCFAGVKL